MSWIRTIPDSEASQELGPLLERSRDPRTGQVDEILRVHSLHPGGLRGHLALYEAVMTGTDTLPKVDRELIALVVSRENGCHY